MRLKNNVKAAISIINYKLFRKRIPLAVCWLVTNRCNFKCSYCKIWKEKTRETPTKDALSLIDQLAELGTQRLSIFGGEPLLRKDIGKIIDHAVDSGLFTGLGSNGLLVPKKINLLKKLDMLHISFDGPNEIHDKQIQKGTFNKVLKSIKVAKDNKIDTWATTVLTKYNLEEIEYILDKMEELQVPIYFQPVMERPLSGDTAPLFPKEVEFKRTVSRLIQEKKKRNIIINSITNLNHMLQWPNHSKKVRCYSKDLRALVDNKGNVVPCDVLVGDKRAMNFTKVGFKRAFDNLKSFDCKDDMKICKSWDYANMEFNHIINFDLMSIKNAFNLLK